MTNQSSYDKSKLVFSAKVKDNPKLADILTQEIPVRPFGFEEKTAQFKQGSDTFDLSLAPDIDVSKSGASLSLSPTILGTVPSAMKYLIDYPYGCVEQTTSRFVPAVIAKANQGLFTEALKDKDIDDIIEKGLSRLKSLQQSDGGWGWWSSGNSDPYITAYVVEYLTLARKSGIKIDAELIGRAKVFLEYQSYPDEGLETIYGPEDSIAKIYGLTVMGANSGYIRQIYDFNNLSADVLSLAVMANYINGNTNPQTNGLNVLKSMAQTQGDTVFWPSGKKLNFGSSDASTALAIRAILLSGGDRDLAVKGIRYLTRSRKTDYWSNTYATSQVIRTIVEFSKTGDELSPNYNYSVLLSGKEIAQGSVKDSKQFIKDINLPIENIKEGSKISVLMNGDGQLYSSLSLNQFHTSRNAKAVNSGLSVKREYVNEKGEEYSLGVGDTAIVKITVGGLKGQENYGVIEDQLPSGLIPINENFKNQQYGQDKNPYYTSYDISDREVTENGMVLSLYQIAPGQRVYTYRARIVSEGTFIVPPAIASLMYAPEINGRTEVQTIKIDKESKVMPGKALERTFGSAKAKPAVISVIVLILLVMVGVLLAWKKGATLKILKEKITKFFMKDNSPPPPGV
ncbi:hypothetical protein HYW44_02600 [Candidatus Daviesbacteria bacterium]|nr:hypothetical protein [Candidatus Daviesbacteria bacterium]